MIALKSYIKSIQYISSIILFNEKKIKTFKYKDEYYNGLNNQKTNVRIFYTPQSERSQTIIIFPGASPYAEEHPSVLMLANALCKAGYNVYLPRIPDLKNLKINKSNIDWFAHCYQELVTHKITNKKNIMIAGLSFGGAALIKATQDERMQNPKPKSVLVYGTYFAINTALNFFITKKIIYKEKEYNIQPHEWGMIVLFYNFIDTITIHYNKNKIKTILKARIKDDYDFLEKKILDLNEKEQTFTRNLLEGKMTDEITSMAIEMIKSNDNTLSELSPSNWASTIKNKIFIVHGANDSMVPFTESFHLHQALPNSEIFISFLYEHREMTSNKGLFFKLKEIISTSNPIRTNNKAFKNSSINSQNENSCL